MNVGELRAALSAFSDDTEVLVTDGYRGLFYKGAFTVEEFEPVDGQYVCDIGIGGCEEDEE